MDDSKTIYTDAGDAIPWMPKVAANHLDKTTLIFGGTGSGKTTVIEEILHLLKDHIPTFLVIVPKTSDAAYRKKLPDRCIKEDLTKKKLQQIWNRQYAATQIYDIANNIDNLSSLFTRAPTREAMVMLKSVDYSASSTIRSIDSSTSLDFGQTTARSAGVAQQSKNFW